MTAMNLSVDLILFRGREKRREQFGGSDKEVRGDNQRICKPSG